MGAFGLVNCKTICGLGLSLSDDLVNSVRFGMNHVFHFGSGLELYGKRSLSMPNGCIWIFFEDTNIAFVVSLAANASEWWETKC